MKKKKNLKKRLKFPAAQKLIKFLEKNKNIISPLLILTHNYPDPDALASAYALQYLAYKGFGIRSKIVYGGIIGRTENEAMVEVLKLPVHKLKSSDFNKYNNVALVDTQPGFKNNSFPMERKATITIDQHASDLKSNSEIRIIDRECGATCVILAQALLLLDFEIKPKLATALAYGILSDTLNLHRVKRADVIQTYLAILPFCNIKSLAQIQNPSHGPVFFNVLSDGISKAQVCGRLVFSHLGFIQAPDLVSQIADFLLSYKEIRWTMTTGRYEGNLYVSLRTKDPKKEAYEVLRNIFTDPGQCGGHGTIAGGIIKVGPKENENSWVKAEKQLVDRLRLQIRVSKKIKSTFPFKK